MNLGVLKNSTAYQKTVMIDKACYSENWVEYNGDNVYRLKLVKR